MIRVLATGENRHRLEDEAGRRVGWIHGRALGFGGKQIRVEGHTDSDPIKVSRWKSNQELSVARADAVKKYLVSKGVDANEVSVAGFGSDRPKSSDKAQNRRVEIVVVTR